MAMNQESLAKFEDQVNAGGVLAYNETLIEAPPTRGDVRIITIPANKIAAELGNPQVANMVAVGGLVTALGVISLDSLVKGLTRELPKHRHHLIPLNEEAIKRGMEVVQESMKGTGC